MWTIGLVQFNQEMKCLAKLKDLGLDAIVPLGKKITRPHRKHSYITTTHILFPGYIFFDIPDGFKLIELSKIKLRFLLAFDGEFKDRKISTVSHKTINQLRNENGIDDLFSEHDKKHIRASYKKNQLVCWRGNNQNYMLGFVSRNTQGKQYSYVKMASGKELKISVDELALL